MTSNTTVLPRRFLWIWLCLAACCSDDNEPQVFVDQVAFSYGFFDFASAIIAHDLESNKWLGAPWWGSTSDIKVIDFDHVLSKDASGQLVRTAIYPEYYAPETRERFAFDSIAPSDLTSEIRFRMAGQFLRPLRLESVTIGESQILGNYDVDLSSGSPCYGISGGQWYCRNYFGQYSRVAEFAGAQKVTSHCWLLSIPGTPKCAFRAATISTANPFDVQQSAVGGDVGIVDVPLTNVIDIFEPTYVATDVRGWDVLESASETSLPSRYLAGFGSWPLVMYFLTDVGEVYVAGLRRAGSGELDGLLDNYRSPRRPARLGSVRNVTKIGATETQFCAQLTSGEVHCDLRALALSDPDVRWIPEFDNAVAFIPTNAFVQCARFRSGWQALRCGVFSAHFNLFEFDAAQDDCKAYGACKNVALVDELAVLRE